MKPTEADTTAPATSGPPPPLRADGYDLGAVIGRGGMGEVLLATDRRIGREVAIKRMLTAAPSDDALARFLREAKIQARLDHPAIVPVHELGQDAEGRPYFTMKRLTGRTLADELAAGAATQPLLRAFAEVCLAIALAHSRGIVHRDLKPANIMLGDFGEVYVLDWGIARVLAEPDAEAGEIMGTPAYMAPEQARGEPVGTAADVYALGAILREILARKPDVPELEAAYAAALAADPGARPTARALGERVQRYLDGDRDLEARRRVAAEQLAHAREAIGADDRATAMQCAGRAIALDPGSDAAALIGSLLLEPPKVLPAELHERLVESDRDYARKQWRTAFRAYLMFFAFLPVLAWQGIREWWLVGVLYAVVAALSIHAFLSARTGRLREWPALLVSGIAIVLTTRLLGVFVFVPSLVCVMCFSWFSYPSLMPYPWPMYAYMLAAGTVPMVLEAFDVFARSWHVTDGAVVISSPALHLGGEATTFLLVSSTIALISIAAFFGRSLAVARRSAQQQLEIQAWHLGKLVGR